MTAFTDLVDEVTTLTNRPDLVNETKTAVKAATLKLHQSDLFFKDLYETGVQFGTADFVQSLEYRTLFPKFRQLKYFRKSEADGTPGDFFRILTPAEILDAYGYQKEDICYAAGELIQIKSSTSFQYGLIGMYVNPTIVEASFNSWMALDHPYAIVYEAAITVFKAIGYDEQATQYTRLAAEQLALVRSSNILAGV